MSGLRTPGFLTLIIPFSEKHIDHGHTYAREYSGCLVSRHSVCNSSQNLHSSLIISNILVHIMCLCRYMCEWRTDLLTLIFSYLEQASGKTHENLIWWRRSSPDNLPELFLVLLPGTIQSIFFTDYINNNKQTKNQAESFYWLRKSSQW